MSDYNAWPSTVGTDGWGFKTRRPKATIYGPPRGSAASRGLFGANPYTATEAQYANRQMFGFRGSGAYRKGRVGARRRIRRLRSGRMRLKTGRGGYFDNMFNFGTISQGTGHAGNLTASGMGDYSVPGIGTVDNAIVGAGFSSAGIPQFAPHESSGVFSKVEFLQSIYAPQLPAGQFQNTVLPLNPGLQRTFPWLALVAPQFEEYEFIQLMFYWRPMVSDFNSGTGQTGEIIMVTQYNPNDPPFTDTLRAKSYDMAMSCKASLSMNHGVECDPTKNSGAQGKYIRTGPLQYDGQGTDIKQYDLGNLNVIVNGTPAEYAGQLLGELWVAYTVQLRKPKLPTSTGDVILRDYFQSTTVPDPTNLSPALSQWQAWVGAPVGYGQQNRINTRGEGCKLTYYDDGANEKLIVTYSIPTWYTGQLELKLAMLMGPDIKRDLTGSIGALTCNNPWSVQSTGVVAFIKDIGNSQLVFSGVTLRDGFVEGNGATTTTYQAYADATATPGVPIGATASCETLIVHADIGANTTGVAQTISILYNHAYGEGEAKATMKGWWLDASEYNTAFNDSQGDVAIESATGQQLTNPFSVRTRVQAL